MVQDFQISERVKLSWSDTAELVGSSSVDEVGLRERVASLATRSIKRDSKLQALNMIVSMCDLTTLEGQDTDGKVSQMVAKAIRPDPNDSSVPSVAAVCVYPGLVETAKKETSGSEVLVASVRTSQHVIDAALIGAHVATVPPKIIHELYNHQLTDKGLKAFLDDWKKTGQSILSKK